MSPALAVTWETRRIGGEDALQKSPLEEPQPSSFSNFLMGPRSGHLAPEPLLCKVRRALGLEGPFYPLMLKMPPRGNGVLGRPSHLVSPRVPSELPLLMGLWSSLPAHLHTLPPTSCHW